MTSLFARLQGLAAFSDFSPSAPGSSAGAFPSNQAMRRLGLCALMLLGGMLAPAHAQLNWVQEFPGASPIERVSTAMAYDAAQGNILLFGGYNGALADLNDTWVWDGTDWGQASPVTSPPAREDHAMAYDAAQGNVVLFGGYGGPGGGTLLNDTWLWDGANWTQASPEVSPPARCCFAMAYDAAQGNVVLFGGYNPSVGGPDFSDTWVWDGANWTQLSPENSPSPRDNFAMAYDIAQGKVVLFGGGADGSPVNDTWVWDGANWTQITPATNPPARYAFAMAYDLAQGNVVLFGGDSGGVKPELLNDTWVWDGTNWTQASPSNSPPARLNHAMSYDATQAVLFGGRDYASSFLNDTWVLETPQVTAYPASLTFPNVRVGNAFAYEVFVSNPGFPEVGIGTAFITPTGGDPTAFSVHEFCRPMLKAGKKCVIAVTFKPHETGSDTATLNVPFNGPTSPLGVPLAGMGFNKK